IERSTNGGTFSTIVSDTGSTSTAYSDSGLNPSTTYTYRVSAIALALTSSPSNTSSATTSSATTTPSPPPVLTATTVSSSQINLFWTAPSNDGGSAITGYNIERSTNGGTFSTILSNTGSTSTTFSDTGLSSSTAYTYQVSAINSVGTSSPSNTASATTSSPPPPATPTGVTATPKSSSSILVSWNASAGAAWYGVFSSTSSSGPFVRIGSSSVTSFTNTGLSPSTTYYYEVRGANPGGVSALSPPVSAITPSAGTTYIALARSGLVVSDPLNNETKTQQQLQANPGYWTYGGDAPLENAPYAVYRDTQGLHVGVQAPSNGTWAGYYALTKHTTAMLFHARISTPVQTLPANNVYYENGMYVQNVT